MHIKTVSQPRGIWWGVLQQWFKGRVANKEQSVYRACTPLIWPHVVSWWMSLVLGRRMLIPTIGAVVQNPPAHVRDVGLISGLGRSPGEGKTIHFSILAWKILWTEEPGGLQSMGSQRVDTTEHTCMMTFCWEFWFWKNSKIQFCVSLEVESEPCPKAAVLFLDCCFLVSLISSFSDLLFETQGS